MSTIQTYVQELKDINLEIKRLKNVISEYKKRAILLEKNILSYLNEKDIPGVKDKDTAIIIENKKKRVNLSKKNLENESLRILESNGISNPKLVLEQLLNARKGEAVETQKVKLTELKKT